jgi:hypothetical protein
MQTLRKLGDAIRAWVSSPMKVISACAIFAALQLVIQGNIFHLFRLHGDRDGLTENLKSIQADILNLEVKIRQAKDPIFIEKEAKDRLDMAGEDELVFVFSSD